MEEKKIKIIIDTNWWISFLVSKSSLGLPAFFFDKNIIFCFSNELRNEIGNALMYARNKKRINSINTQVLFNFLKDIAIFYQVTSIVEICRDAKDNFLLALAKDAKADFLITTDKDILEIQQFENTIICTLKDFIQKISGQT